MPNEQQTIRLVLRYRDLLAHTLDEHKEIIEQNGACWWGWWKRPLEDLHLSVWEWLNTALHEHKTIRIGLFDSGSDTVHAARVTDLKAPTLAGDGVIFPQLNSEETELVPSYYARNPFSKAWLKLEEIETQPIDFFGKYSLRVAPPLKNYPDDVLQRLTKKVIKSGIELRSMDTTIWEVRPKEKGDSEDTVYAPSAFSIGEPVSPKPVLLQANTILHITDPHYACDPHRKQHVWSLEKKESGNKLPPLMGAVLSAIGQRKIGLVIVTGDLTFSAKPEEFEEAAAGLNRLAGVLDLDPSQIVIIPGNHDIQWSKNNAYEDDAPVTQASDEAEQNYRKFYADFHKHPPHPHLAMGRRFVLPFGGLLDITEYTWRCMATSIE